MDTKTLENLGFINSKVLSFSSDQSSYEYKFATHFKNVVSVEVSAALIPRSEYTIEMQRNQFFIKKNSSVYSIILESRNYSPQELVDSINVRIAAIDITVQYNESKHILEFTSPEQFELDMKSSNVYQIFGFDKEYYISNLIEGTFFISAPKKLNTLGTDVLYIHSSVDSIRDSNCGYDVPLAVFYLYDGSNLWQDVRQTPERYFHPIGKLDRLLLEFRNKNGEIYNFHGQVYNVQLIVKYIDYGKNWSVLDKESAHTQVHNALAEMVNSAVSQTLAKAEFKMVEQLKSQQKKEVAGTEWSSSAKLGVGVAACATMGGLIYYYLQNDISVSE
jgi:hypothetical protein